MSVNDIYKREALIYDYDSPKGPASLVYRLLFKNEKLDHGILELAPGLLTDDKKIQHILNRGIQYPLGWVSIMPDSKDMHSLYFTGLFVHRNFRGGVGSDFVRAIAMVAEQQGFQKLKAHLEKDEDEVKQLVKRERFYKEKLDFEISDEEDEAYAMRSMQTTIATNPKLKNFDRFRFNKKLIIEK